MRDQQILFAEAVATAATEFAQEISDLPPSAQRKHAVRITALTEVSQKLSLGEPVDTVWMPGFDLTVGQPQRPRPPA